MSDTDGEYVDSRLPDSARAVLLAGPPTDRLRSLCTALHRVEESTHLLFVTYTRRPVDYVDALPETRTDDVTVITVGDAVPGEDAPVATRHVEAPADLTQLGIEIGDVLDAHERVSLCLDSVTTTLQYASDTDAHEFLHAIVGRLQPADAHAHVHINPLAHDEQVLAGLLTLFDARVDLDAGGDLSVDVRPPTGRNV